MRHTETVLELHDLTKSYGGTQILGGVTLRASRGDRGEILALLGRNGAGKTTLIRILATLLRPDSGTARVAGHDVVREPGAVRAAIALTGQEAAVDERLTGRENLVMIGRLLGLRPRAARDRADELLSQFSLTDAGERRLATYSGGMRRRLDLALSLVRRPAVLFLDEPTTGLDVASREALWRDIEAITRGGTVVLLTTQYLEEADRLADRIAVLADGRIVADGTPAELKAALGGPRLLIDCPSGGGAVEIVTTGTAGDIAEALGSQPIDAVVRLETPTLDDVFITLTADLATTGRPQAPATDAPSPEGAHR